MPGETCVRAGRGGPGAVRFFQTADGERQPSDSRSIPDVVAFNNLLLYPLKLIAISEGYTKM